MLTELQKHTIQQIAEKKGDNPDWWEYRYNGMNQETADTWLLGYLLEKSTTVKVFGDNSVCRDNCYGGDVDQFEETDSDEWYCGNCGEPAIEAWQYHGHELVDLSDSLEAVLDYYGKYLGEAKGAEGKNDG